MNDRRQQTIEILRRTLKNPDAKYCLTDIAPWAWICIQKLRDGSIDPSTVLIERLEME